VSVTCRTVDDRRVVPTYTRADWAYRLYLPRLWRCRCRGPFRCRPMPQSWN